MKEILSHYQINNQTLAIAPAKSADYRSIVYEGNRILFITKSPLDIIKENCLGSISTYTGRREAVMHQLGYKQKVPIPIIIKQQVYAFPTQSPKDFNCIWLFYQHVLHIKPIEVSTTENATEKSVAIFNNGIELPINISHYILERQMQRTARCISKFGDLVGV